MADKNGIGFVGNVIVDDVSEVLEQGNVVYSDGWRYLTGDDEESERVEYGTGGMALNNSVNMADMGADYPIRVMGKVGCDENAARIRTYLANHRLDDSLLIVTPDHPTSTTQVLYIRDSSGRVNRTFRHSFGAMGDFRPADIRYEALSDLRIVMIGYCLLMPLFDRGDPDYGAVIGRALERIRSMGILTCIDFVTPKREKWWKFKRFRKTLRWVDILSIGEDQAEGITGLADERAACRSLVEDCGVGLAVVHCGDRGANHLYSAATGLISQPIFIVPPEEYAGNTGAGDAFTSGLLHCIHRGWNPAVSLKYATAAAAVSLGSVTSTGAMREEAYILEYMQTRPTYSSRRME
jgi:sugar/nucleoside kinase (ribokinase family)